METEIKEIFASIQGEGPIVGFKQLFIRFCNCNLKCDYCDTDFDIKNAKKYTPQNLFEEIISKYDLKTFHSISLTGGEPLLSADFLKEFLPLINDKVKIYLETNATLTDQLDKTKEYVDIIATDIKLKSSTGLETAEKHKKFFEKCNKIQTFEKIVFDKNITDEEIKTCTDFGKNFNIELVLQPKMIKDKMSVSSEFCTKILDKFIQIYPNTRLIPQVHKFIDIR